MKKQARPSRDMVRARTSVRNALICEMHTQLGLSDMQIAHAYLKGDPASTIIVPGLNKTPEELREIAYEYIRKFRGSDCGPLIRRNLRKKGYDKNRPMEVSDIRDIIRRGEKQLQTQQQTRHSPKNASLFDEWEGHGDIHDQVQELRMKVEELSEYIRSKQAEPEATQNATPQQILSEDRRLSSVAIPPELLAEIRKEVAIRSNQEGRRVATWELIAEALLGKQRAHDIRMCFKEAAG